MGRELPKVLTFLDFVGAKPTDTDIVLVPSVWNKLGTYTVPNGMMMAVGKRFDGYVYCRIDSDGTGQIHGRIRIKVSNPTEDLKIPVLEFNTRACKDANGKQDKPFVVLTPPWAQPHSKLILEYYNEPILHAKPTAAIAEDTIDLSDADTQLTLDVTYKLIN